MMGHPLKIAAAAAAALLLAIPAQAQQASCRLRIDANPSSWIINGYDPFANNEPSGNFDLIFTNDGDAECVFYPIFILDQEPFGLRSISGGRANYGVVDLFGGYDATPVGGRTRRQVSRRSVAVPPRGQQVVQYRLIVDEAGLSRSGLHEQRVELQAEDLEGVPITSRQLVLGVDVLPSATLGLSGAFRLNNGQAQVDLGELQEGVAEVPLQLRVQSTGPYKLTLESMNNGRLVLPGTDWFVSYGLALGGQSITLSGGRGEYTGTTPNMHQDSLAVRFQIGDVSDRRAGIYRDIISVAVSPL
ncbi:hypothetical protein [Sphingosinicella terrae]|uniref:hypothetical protein n=1 Tax=Sphingosinicella terrae TaxID=2172047 RepID=UPI00254976B2|nr:hypothetical protein [Sphingosinicella terrae]